MEDFELLLECEVPSQPRAWELQLPGLRDRVQPGAAPPSQTAAPAALADVLQLEDGENDTQTQDEGYQTHFDEDDEEEGQEEGGDAHGRAALRHDGGGDEEIVEANVGLEPSQILARIEELVSSLVEGIAQGQLPVLSMASRAAHNVVMVPAAAAAVGAAGGAFDDDGPPAGRRRRLALGSRVQEKSMLHSNGTQALGVARGGCTAGLGAQQAVCTWRVIGTLAAAMWVHAGCPLWVLGACCAHVNRQPHKPMLRRTAAPAACINACRQ